MRGNRAIIIGAILVAVVIGAAILTAPGSPDPYIWIMGHLSSTFAPEEWWMIERFRLKHAAVFNIGGGERLG
jgi:hypothetical protein